MQSHLGIPAPALPPPQTSTTETSLAVGASRTRQNARSPGGTRIPVSNRPSKRAVIFPIFSPPRRKPKADDNIDMPEKIDPFGDDDVANDEYAQLRARITAMAGEEALSAYFIAKVAAEGPLALALEAEKLAAAEVARKAALSKMRAAMTAAERAEETASKAVAFGSMTGGHRHAILSDQPEWRSDAFVEEMVRRTCYVDGSRMSVR